MKFNFVGPGITPTVLENTDNLVVIQEYTFAGDEYIPIFSPYIMYCFDAMDMFNRYPNDYFAWASLEKFPLFPVIEKNNE